MKLRLPALCALSLAVAGCATTPSGYAYQPYPQTRYVSDEYGYDGRPTRCYDCGVVERIERFYGERTASGAGAVLGGIVGGVLGNQIGSGSGRRVATVAGAVAGGVAGNRMERNANGAPRYELYIRMDDGSRRVVVQRDLNGIREGAYVSVRYGRARLI